MPAAAVIPAPIAYIKVVAVKKLVVEFLECSSRLVLTGLVCSLHPRGEGSFLNGLDVRNRVFYCEKIRVFKAGVFA